MVILGINLLIYIFAIAGIMLAFKKRNRLAIAPVSVVAYFALLHWATLPLFRYMMPVMPYVIAFAAYSLLAVATEPSTLTASNMRNIWNGRRSRDPEIPEDRVFRADVQNSAA